MTRLNSAAAIVLRLLFGLVATSSCSAGPKSQIDGGDVADTSDAPVDDVLSAEAEHPDGEDDVMVAEVSHATNGDLGDAEADGGTADSNDAPLCPIQVDGGSPIATIVFAPSTNECGSATNLYCDGSASYHSTPCRFPANDGTCLGSPCSTVNEFPPGTEWVLQCLADLMVVGDLRTIKAKAAYLCEAASTGTALYIGFNGTEVGDLNCPTEPLTPAQTKMLADCVRR